MGRIRLFDDTALLYDSGAVTPPPPPTPVPTPTPDPSNRFVGFWNEGYRDLWTVMKDKGFNITAADLGPAEAAGFPITDGIKAYVASSAQLTPDGFDPYRTSLTAADAGKVFKARAGRTRYTFAGVTDWRTVPDGLMHVDARCSVSIDGAPWMDVTGASSKVGTGSTMDIDCNYEWSVQVGG